MKKGEFSFRRKIPTLKPKSSFLKEKESKYFIKNYFGSLKNPPKKIKKTYYSLNPFKGLASSTRRNFKKFLSYLFLKRNN